MEGPHNVCVCGVNELKTWLFRENILNKRHDSSAVYAHMIWAVAMFIVVLSESAICSNKCHEKAWICMHVFTCVFVCVRLKCVTLLTMTPFRPAAEQKVLGGVGSLVRGLTLPSNMVPIETRHKTSCRHTTIIKCTCTSWPRILFGDNDGTKDRCLQ